MKVAIVLSMDLRPDDTGNPVEVMVDLVREALEQTIERHSLSDRIEVHAAVAQSADQVMAVFEEAEGG